MTWTRTWASLQALADELSEGEVRWVLPAHTGPATFQALEAL